MPKFFQTLRLLFIPPHPPRWIFFKFCTFPTSPPSVKRLSKNCEILYVSQTLLASTAFTRKLSPFFTLLLQKFWKLDKIHETHTVRMCSGCVRRALSSSQRLLAGTRLKPMLLIDETCLMCFRCLKIGTEVSSIHSS
jgi:hypothetical protein